MHKYLFYIGISRSSHNPTRFGEILSHRMCCKFDSHTIENILPCEPDLNLNDQILKIYNFEIKNVLSQVFFSWTGMSQVVVSDLIDHPAELVPHGSFVHHVPIEGPSLSGQQLQFTGRTIITTCKSKWNPTLQDFSGAANKFDRNSTFKGLMYSSRYRLGLYRTNVKM